MLATIGGALARRSRAATSCGEAAYSYRGDA
jgi:hypothetical protein